MGLPKYIYTGYSDNQDGLLVLTDMDWDEFCQSQGGSYRSINGEDVLVLDETLTDEDIEDVIDEGEHRWGSMAIFRAEVKVNENLSGAVCW